MGKYINSTQSKKVEKLKYITRLEYMSHKMRQLKTIFVLSILESIPLCQNLLPYWPAI